MNLELPTRILDGAASLRNAELRSTNWQAERVMEMMSDLAKFQGGYAMPGRTWLTASI